MHFVNPSLINNLVASASISSSPVDMNQVVKFSVQASVGTGTVNGSLQIQVSNDPCSIGNLYQDFTPTNWSNLGSAVAIAASGVFLIAQQDSCYRSLRAVFTDASGGTSTAKITVNLMASAL